MAIRSVRNDDDQSSRSDSCLPPDIEKKEIAKFGDHRVYRIIEKLETIFIVSYISESEIDKYQQENEAWYLIPPSMYHTDDCDKVYEVPLMITK